jgi:hypothetical protein
MDAFFISSRRVAQEIASRVILSADLCLKQRRLPVVDGARRSRRFNVRKTERSKFSRVSLQSDIEAE